MLIHDQEPEQSRLLQREAHPHCRILQETGARTARTDSPHRGLAATGHRVREDKIAAGLGQPDQPGAGQRAEDHPRAGVRAGGRHLRQSPVRGRTAAESQREQRTPAQDRQTRKRGCGTGEPDAEERVQCQGAHIERKITVPHYSCSIREEAGISPRCIQQTQSRSRERA